MLNLYRFERKRRGFRGLREFFFFAAEDRKDAAVEAEKWLREHHRRLESWGEEGKLEFNKVFEQVPVVKGLVMKS